MEDEEKKPKRGRFLFLGIALFVVLAVYVLRLADWQIFNVQKWLNAADRSGTSSVKMDAARGEIIDAKGTGLAVNQTGYAIMFNAAYVTSGTRNQTILTLVHLLDSRNEKWVDVLPIQLNSAGKYEFIPGKEKEVTVLKSKGYLNMEPYATADQCMKHLVDQYKCTGYSAKDTRDIVSVRYNMTKTGFSISAPYTFAEDVSKDTVAIMEENSASLPGAEAKVTTVRKYPDGSLMPQILGAVGAISKEEYDALHKTKGYALDAQLGKSGVEKTFEDLLRGTAGEKTVNLAENGSVASEAVTKAPVPGDTVQLTLDSNLQKVANASLAKNIQGTREYGKILCRQNHRGTSKWHGEDCVAGAAVVLRVSDFAVLAASTYPSYDQNQYKTDPSYYSQLIQDKARPLINRAFNGVFTPGSSFKPSVALAALQEGAITNSTVITCNGVYTRFASSGLRIHCMGHHGPITLRTALAKSCNVFFCETGYRTGITAMNLYAKRLGLGQKTGVEIGESSGTLAGPAERKAAGGRSWSDGDTVQAAIGQSDNQLTPIQLATYCATIANNGTRLKTHLVDKVLDYSRKKTISVTKPQTVDSIGVSQTNLNYVKAGMRYVVTGGTASGTFANYGVAIAGKTGTAQTGNGSDNELFIGFAPYDKPQIAIAVVLEHGATGKYVQAVAKDIFDAYFYGKTVDAQGNLVMPSAVSSSSAQAAG